MSEAQKLILEALRKSLPPFDGFDHACAVAAADVDRALGGPKREKRILPQWRETGELHHDRFFQGKPVPKTELHYVDQSRWVSDWTVTE